MKKIIYFGSSQFSKIILEELLAAAIRPRLIVTRPDAPKGRGLKLSPTQISILAQDKKIKTIKPASLKGEDIREAIAGFAPDYLIAADYGNIIPGYLLSLPEKLPLGLHPSLLPAYRGPAPIERALINGDKITGATVFCLDRGIDCGKIILQQKIKINDDDNYFSLRKKIALLGVKTLVESFTGIETGSLEPKPQDESQATFAPKLCKKDGKIDWNDSAEKNRNLIRATLAWPTAYTRWEDKTLKITEAESLADKSKQAPGTIIKIAKDGIYTASGSRILKIKKVKPAGKKEMSASSFACGYRLKAGGRFTA